MVQQKGQEVLHFSTWQECCSTPATRAINYVPAGWLSPVRRPRVSEIPSMECRPGPVNLSAWHPRDAGVIRMPTYTHLLVGCGVSTICSLLTAVGCGVRNRQFSRALVWGKQVSTWCLRNLPQLLVITGCSCILVLRDQAPRRWPRRCSGSRATGRP